MKSWLQKLIALLGGASLASIVASLLGGSAHPWYEVLLPIWLGNLLLAGGLFVLLLLMAPVAIFRNGFPETSKWMWFAFLAGLVPSLGPIGVPGVLFFPLVIVLIFAVMRLGKALPALSSGISSSLTVLVFFASLGGGYWNHMQLRLLNDEISSPTLASNPNPKVFQAPDIILISLDTLRADAVTGPRAPAYELPFFDGMRSSGNWWDYSYSSSNQTLPGHASMLSGHDALASGVRFNFNHLPNADELPLLSEYLQDAGYQTAGVISNALIAGDMGFSRGYDLYDDSTTPRFGPRTACAAYLAGRTWTGHMVPSGITERVLSMLSFRASRRPPRAMDGIGMEQRGLVTTTQAKEVLDQLYATEQPYFFFLHYLDAHHPYGAPAPYRGTLTADLAPLAERYRGPEKSKGMIGLDQLNIMKADLRSDNPAVHAEAVAGAEFYRQMYLENVMYLDSQLEEVRQYVEKSGRPTLWLITGDHGEQFSENDSLVHGNHLYQDSVRVPFMLSGPGIEAGVQRQGIPDVADVAPTLLEYAGLEVPAEMTGRSVLGSGALPTIVHVLQDDVRLMVRYGSQKLIAKRTGDGFDVTAVYDLAIDPEELQNLIGQADFETQLVAILEEQLLRDRFVDRGGALSAEQTAALGDLGYVDSAEEDEHQH